VIACVRMAYFAATILRQDDPGLSDSPVILAHYKGGRGKVYAACAVAEAAGVCLGMPLSRARALCPEAQITPASPGRTRRALDKLLALLTDYSQWIEAERNYAQTAAIYIDLGKLTPREGQLLAEQIIHRVADAGFAASVGLAAGKFPALVAAKASRSGNVTLVRRGEEAAYLASLPVTLLPLDRETARRLDLLGLRQMGQVAALPRSAVIAQFGKEGGRLHRLASGVDTRRVARYMPPVVESARRQFEPPLDNLLPLETIMGALAAELALRLANSHLDSREITLTLRLDDHSEQEIQARPREPVSGSLGLYRALQTMTAQLKVRSSVVELEVRLGRLSPVLPRQLSLFDAPMQCDPRPLLLELAERYDDIRFYSVALNSQPSRLPERRFHLERLDIA
jgi:DNA polymerase IV